MTHEDAGKYAGKHPSGTARSEQVATAIRERSPGGTLTCALAEKISKDLMITIAEVGKTADLLEMKIKECQLGLFGWGDKPHHGKDIPASDSVPVAVKDAIEKVARDGVVTCAMAWTIAAQLRVGRKAVSGACEALGLKIRACQLGAF